MVGQVEVATSAAAPLSMQAVLLAMCADREVVPLLRRWARPRRGVIAALAHRTDEVWREVSLSSLRPLGHPSRAVSVVREINLGYSRARKEGEDSQGVQEVTVHHGEGAWANRATHGDATGYGTDPRGGATEAPQLPQEAR